MLTVGVDLTPLVGRGSPRLTGIHHAGTPSVRTALHWEREIHETGGSRAEIVGQAGIPSKVLRDAFDRARPARAARPDAKEALLSSSGVP